MQGDRFFDGHPQLFADLRCILLDETSTPDFRSRPMTRQLHSPAPVGVLPGISGAARRRKLFKIEITASVNSVVGTLSFARHFPVLIALDRDRGQAAQWCSRFAFSDMPQHLPH